MLGGIVLFIQLMIVQLMEELKLSSESINLVYFFGYRKQLCRLSVTHDDYSIVSKLPRERTLVVTILRNLVDRVFSFYDFSVEVTHTRVNTLVQSILFSSIS